MKSEVIFGLEDAVWPALLVSAAGAVLMSNPAARTVFGSLLAGGPPQLNAIWVPANGQPADFLVRWEAAPAAVTELSFRTANGMVQNFSTAVARLTRDSNKWFVLQLLPPAKAATGGESKNPATGDMALKQRLDCTLQLARTVSLDFNNALTGVLAHTSLLLGKAEANHPWRRSLLEVEKAAARAAEIANELAQFSWQEKEARRAPSGNLNTVVERCADFFRSASGSHLTWRLTQERALFSARFDEAKVQQALMQVFENAVEAFSHGGPGQVTVETRNVELTEATQDRNVQLAAGTYVCMEISDDGTGIEEAAMAKIFEPFFTTKNLPHRGLGLALVYGIITNHGGGVAISSQAGKGTSARIYLPAEKKIVRATVAGAEKNLEGTGTILVVDDESMMLTMAETILSDFGYHVLTANSGQKALNVLSQSDTKVDLVITDLVMPGMGGRELVERIRKTEPTLAILCTSGYVIPEDKQTGDGYLQKPFTSTDLLLKVKAVLSP
jgi:signal transduction histidine kinase/CheY-like chemotaxis protein